MALRCCNHIKSDGIECHLPAMRDRKFCHNHAQYRRSILSTRQTPSSIAIPMVDANRNLIHVDVEEPYAQRYKLGALEDGPALEVEREGAPTPAMHATPPHPRGHGTPQEPHYHPARSPNDAAD